MADDKRADNGKHHDDKQAADKKAAAAKEDMTPAPTQAELDGPEGEKAKKEKAAEPRKASEDLTPTPTQAENDDIKAKLFGTTVEEDQKRRKEYEEAKGKAAPEDMTPSPTQAENDQAKLAAMYVPDGAGDPQKTDAPQPQRRTVEAARPGAYQTRAAEPAKAE